MGIIHWIEMLVLFLLGGKGTARSSPSSLIPSGSFHLGNLQDGSQFLLSAIEAIRLHLYSVGASGTGKSTFLTALVTHCAGKCSVVLIDMAGDLVASTMRLLPSLGVDPSKVYLFDAGDEKTCPSFNPLLGVGEAQHLAFGLVAFIRRLSPSWGVTIEQTFRATCLVLVQARLSILEFDRLLLDRPFRLEALSKTTDPFALAFFEQFECLTAEQRRNQHMACSNKLATVISDRRLRATLGTGSTDKLREALDTEGSVILISLPQHILGEAAGALGELLLHFIWNTVQSRSKLPEAERPRTRLFVDEFQMCGDHLFADMVAEGRRWGLALCLAHQSQVQLDAKLRATIRNNSAVRVLFAPGPVDASELASELAPMNHAEAYAALMQLRTGDAYVCRRGERAVRIRTNPPRKVEVTDDDAAEFREAVLAHSARTFESIEAELQGRTRSDEKSESEVRSERKPWFD